MRGTTSIGGSRRGRGTLVALLLACMVAWAVPGGARAQDDATNPYAFFHGLDTFEEGGREVGGVRFPASTTLRSWEEHPAGVRLRYSMSYSSDDLMSVLYPERSSIRVYTLTTGVEFVIPFRPALLLRPYADAGFGTREQSRGLDFLGLAGIRAEWIHVRNRFIFGLEPGLQVSHNAGTPNVDRTVIKPRMVASVRHDLGIRIGGYLPDVGVYADISCLLPSPEGRPLETNDADVSAGYEFGIGLGFSRTRPRLGFLSLPRVRLGYRFGDVSGVRFRIGGDWLIVVAPL